VYNNDGQSHFVWIKNINAFFKEYEGHHNYVCDTCFVRFSSKDVFDRHKTIDNKCVQYVKGFIEKQLPQEDFVKQYVMDEVTGKREVETRIGDDGIKYDVYELPLRLPKNPPQVVHFKAIRKCLRQPFVVYYDFESILKKVETNDKEAIEKKRYQHHQPYNVGFKLVSQYPDLIKSEYKSFHGHDCAEKFLEALFELQDKIINIISKEIPANRTKEDEALFESASECYLCLKPFSKYDPKVFDHNHLTGKYRGALHSRCNIQFSHKYYRLPVIAHNSKKYDAHLILQTAGKLKTKIVRKQNKKGQWKNVKVERKVSCIANTMEQYTGFDIDKCRFLDSIQFMTSSLEKLVGYMVQSKQTFPCFDAEIGFQDEMTKHLLLQKGVFPYDWYDEPSKVEFSQLPSQDNFANKLNDSKCKDVDYKRASLVWEKTGCKTFQDYLNIYLKQDVLLLADVFENFRNMCMEYHGIDPAHCYTLPSVSWEAMLFSHFRKQNQVKIECFKNGYANNQQDMFNMVQRGMRGGISVISHRYAKANNPYMKEYDKSKPSSYIVYLDANGLYGWAMTQYLPCNSFEWDMSIKTEYDSTNEIVNPQLATYITKGTSKLAKLKADPMHRKDKTKAMNFLKIKNIVKNMKNVMYSQFDKDFESMQDEYRKKMQDLKAEALALPVTLALPESTRSYLQSLPPQDVLKYFEMNEIEFHLPLSDNISWEEEQKQEEKQYSDALNAKWTTKYILKQKDDQEEGYILEVDLDIPESKHDDFNDYPVAPESCLFGNARKKKKDDGKSEEDHNKPRFEASPFMKYIKNHILEQSNAETAKLAPNLLNKTKYVCHYRNLKLYIQQGCKLTKVHRVLKFKQGKFAKIRLF
jgi:hypothetical protein